MSTQVDWIATEVCDALPVLYHTYGYLPSHRTSPSPDQYQIILLADRGTCVWTTCPKSLPESVRPETHDLRSRKSNDVATMPHNTYRETVNSKCREKVLVTLRELYFSQCHGAWCLKCDKKNNIMNTHTPFILFCECFHHHHTFNTFNGSLSGITRVSQYQKGKTNLDFNGARDSEWQWHQLCHMQVCTSLQTDNHASTPPLSFLQAGCPSCRPTNSVKALKAPCVPIIYAKGIYRAQNLKSS